MKSKFKFFIIPTLFFSLSVLFFVLFFVYDENVNINDLKMPEIDFNLNLPQDLGLTDDVIVVSSINKNSENLENNQENNLLVVLFNMVFKKDNNIFKLVEDKKDITNGLFKIKFDNSTMILKEDDKMLVKQGENKLEFKNYTITNIGENYELSFELGELYNKIDNNYFPNTVFFNGKKYGTFVADSRFQINYEDKKIILSKGSKVEFIFEKDLEKLFFKCYKNILEVDFEYEKFTEDYFTKKFKIWENQITEKNSDINEILESIYMYKYNHNATEFPEAVIENLVNNNGYLLNYKSAIWTGDFYSKERIMYNQLNNNVYKYRDWFYNDRKELLSNSEDVLNAILLFPNVISKKNIETYLKKIDINTLDVISLNGYINYAINFFPDDTVLLEELAKTFISFLNYDNEIYTLHGVKDIKNFFTLEKIGIKLNDLKILKLSKYLILNNLKNDNNIKSYLIYNHFSKAGSSTFSELKSENNSYQIFSNLDKIEVEDNIEDNSLTITMNGKVDETYNFVIYNLTNFSDLQMFEKVWQRDFQYQKDFSGAYYDYANRKLFIKLKFRTEEEKITVKFLNRTMKVEEI